MSNLKWPLDQTHSSVVNSIQRRKRKFYWKKNGQYSRYDKHPLKVTYGDNTVDSGGVYNSR